MRSRGRVDLVSAITKGDPKGAAALGATLSPWPHNTVAEIKASQDRLKTFIGSGQLGIYGSGYWGHPAMKLPPDVNLLAAHHYLQALHYQRRINMVVSILGSKTPHVQTLTVGGVTNPINPNAPDTLNMERLYYVKTLLDEANDFVKQVMVPDTAAVAAMYADWTGIGKGVVDYLSVPEMPVDTKGTKFVLPGGYIPGGDVAELTPITSYQDPFFKDNVAESVKHSWYDGDWTKHPWEETRSSWPCLRCRVAPRRTRAHCGRVHSKGRFRGVLPPIGSPDGTDRVAQRCRHPREAAPAHHCPGTPALRRRPRGFAMTP